MKTEYDLEQRFESRETGTHIPVQDDRRGNIVVTDPLKDTKLLTDDDYSSVTSRDSV